MDRIVVALYDHAAAAMDAVRELEQQGFGPDVVSTIGHKAAFPEYREDRRPVDMPAIGPVYMSGAVENSLSIGQGGQRHLVDYLAGAGLPQRDADLYAEGVRRGGILVAVSPMDRNAELARTIMDRHHPVVLQDMEHEWMRHGWSHFDRSADPLDENQLDWPRNIAARGEEKFKSDMEVLESNWPENITDPNRIPPQEEEEPSWPHSITARGDEAPEEEVEEEERNWPHNITARPDED